MQKSFIKISIVTLSTTLAPLFATAQSIQDSLLLRALNASHCELVADKGKYCQYQFGNILSFGIGDVGGTDTAIGFINSNIKNELYAVMYYGCIAVVPGESHPKNYDKNFGVFISPQTGLVYRTPQECKASLQISNVIK